MTGLLKAIKADENVRRLFGQQELRIIEKQLLGIQLSKSERTRLSRDIRKKFNAIRELSEFVKEFELKKGAEIKWVVEEVKKDILKSEFYPKIKKIVLFGSSVENQRTYRSDIDISVEFDKINLREATKFRVKMYFDDIVDIQVYNVLPEKIKKEIDLKGKVIYDRKNKR